MTSARAFMRLKRSWTFTLLIGLLIAAASAAAETEWVTVRWVADGDTVVLTDGRHVRYLGIDAPEIDHPDRPGEPHGDAARILNRSLVEAQPIRLVLDREPKDRYGRVLAYVYRSDGLFINAEMVRRGYAHVLPQHPNLARFQDLLHAQRDAMRLGRGIWQTVDPSEKPVRPYLGNRRSRRFHARDCPRGQRMARHNRVELENQWQAFWNGYAPARECIPFPK